MDAKVNFQDIKTGKQETLFFFFFNSWLCSRIDTKQESREDEEVNIYMAQLLASLFDGRFYTEHVDLLATTPAEVFGKVEKEARPYHKLQVYRANADHRLMAFGIFANMGERQSRLRQSLTPPDAYLEEAEQYYGWAAEYARYMPTRYQALGITMKKLAAGFDTYYGILVHLANNHLNLLSRLTPGELFHLERKVNQAAGPGIAQIALDKMLDAFNAWRTNPTPENEAKYQQACEQYRQTNPAFNPNQP